MTTAAPPTTARVYARYHGGLGGGPFDWTPDVRMISDGGCIFLVTPDGLPGLLRFEHGSERERTFFTRVEEDYFLSLRRCEPCNVAFETELAEKRHLRFHAEREDRSPEIAELAQLDAKDAEDRRIRREAAIRKERAVRRQELEATIDTTVRAHIVDPNVTAEVVDKGVRP